MDFEITLKEFPKEIATDGEVLSAKASLILRQMLADSAQRQLALPFTPENQSKVSEEIGFRRALMIFAAHFGE